MRCIFMFMLILAAIAVALPVAVIKPHALTGRILVPAKEATKIDAPMTLTTIDGKTCLVTPKGMGERPPTAQTTEAGGKASFLVTIENEDDYTIFANVRWDGGAGNSFWVKMDSLPYSGLGNDGPDLEWTPIKGPAWHLKPGKHLLVIREREWGAAVESFILSLVPDYVSTELAFKTSVALTDTLQAYRENSFFSKTMRMLVFPSYSLAVDSQIRFSLFIADTCKAGILASAKMNPVTITGPNGKVIYSGTMPASSEARIALSSPLPGKYLLRSGNLTKEWALLGSKVNGLKQAIMEMKAGKNLTDKDSLWLPTLELCRDNILRGYKLRKMGENYLPDLNYVTSEISRTEAILSALKAKKTEALVKPGIMELAYFSSVDTMICPYTIYLPKGYFSAKKRSPFILYLHGSNGTQWEMERSAEANHRRMADLELPLVIPFARGNSEYVGAAETDILKLIPILTRHFRFDSTQIILSGFSMGGMGTWYYGSKYPSLFSILIPIAGGLPWEMDKAFPWKPGDRILPKEWKGRIVILHGLTDGAVSIKWALSAQAQMVDIGIPSQTILSRNEHVIPGTVFDVYNNLYGVMQKVAP